MQIPTSPIDPTTVLDAKRFAVALKDDDWDHWDDASQAHTYIGYRSATGRWVLTSWIGEQLDWTYEDSEVIVLRPA